MEREGLWLLPASHLLMEESPDHAARRIAKEWIGLQGMPRLLMVQSHKRPSKLWKLRGGRENHWDICFVYTLKSNKIPKLRPWWKEMKYVPRSQIKKLGMGRGHADILKEAGFTSP
ncbi:MAG: NUDIX hydrolase [Nitrososphaerales archaeon]